MAKENLQATYALYSHLPLRGKRLYDKAMIGRLAVGKPLNKYEKQIGEMMPRPSKKEHYVAERAVTHPVGAALVSGGLSAGLHATKLPRMEALRKYYTSLESNPVKPPKNPKMAPVANALELARKKIMSVARIPLLEKNELKIIREPERIKELYAATPKSIATKGIKWGLIAGGGAMLARHLHAKALLGEVMKEHTMSKQRDPSEYIRTKLRGDVELKHKAESLAKTSAKKKSVNPAIPVAGGAGIGVAGAAGSLALSHAHDTILTKSTFKPYLGFPGVRKIQAKRLAQIAETYKGIRKPTLAVGAVAGAVAGLGAYGVKKYQEKHAMDQTAQKLIAGVADIMKQAAFGMPEAKALLGQGKALAEKGIGYMKGQALNAVGKGEVGEIRNLAKGVSNNVENAANASRAMKKQVMGAAITGGPVLAAGGAMMMGGKKEKTAELAEKQASLAIEAYELLSKLADDEAFRKMIEKKKEEKEGKKGDKDEDEKDEKKKGKDSKKEEKEEKKESKKDKDDDKDEDDKEKKAAKLTKEEFVERFVKAKKGDKKEEKKETKK